MRPVIYKCKENDAVIKLYFKDGDIDELLIGYDGGTSWNVIGYNDLKNAVIKAESKLNEGMILPTKNKSGIKISPMKFICGTCKEEMNLNSKPRCKC